MLMEEVIIVYHRTKIRLYRNEYQTLTKLWASIISPFWPRLSIFPRLLAIFRNMIIIKIWYFYTTEFLERRLIRILGASRDTNFASIHHPPSSSIIRYCNTVNCYPNCYRSYYDIHFKLFCQISVNFSARENSNKERLFYEKKILSLFVVASSKVEFVRVLPLWSYVALLLNVW